MFRPFRPAFETLEKREVLSVSMASTITTPHDALPPAGSNQHPAGIYVEEISGFASHTRPHNDGRSLRAANSSGGTYSLHVGPNIHGNLPDNGGASHAEDLSLSLNFEKYKTDGPRGIASGTQSLDAETDGDTDGADFLLWNAPANTAGRFAAGDSDRDGDVDGDDFLIWHSIRGSEVDSATLHGRAAQVVAHDAVFTELGLSSSFKAEQRLTMILGSPEYF